MGPLFALWIIWGSTYMGIALVVKSMPPLLGGGSRFAVSALLLGTVVLIFRGPQAFRITWA